MHRLEERLESDALDLPNYSRFPHYQIRFEHNEKLITGSTVLLAGGSVPFLRHVMDLPA